MTFYEVIEGLYSDDIHKVCDMLNKGEYLFNTAHEEILLVHTGFCCQIQTGTIFEVLYSVLDKKHYFLKKRDKAFIGFPFIVNTIDNQWDIYGYNTKGKTNWFDKYNLRYESFHSVFVKDVKCDDLKCNALVLDDKVNTVISNFLICNDEVVVKTYPLCRLDMPFIYYGHSTFSPYNPSSHTDKEDSSSWRNYGSSYEMYNGYNDWSDDIINDVFDGFPEATWNID